MTSEKDEELRLRKLIKRLKDWRKRQSIEVQTDSLQGSFAMQQSIPSKEDRDIDLGIIIGGDTNTEVSPEEAQRIKELIEEAIKLGESLNISPEYIQIPGYIQTVVPFLRNKRQLDEVGSPETLILTIKTSKDTPVEEAAEEIANLIQALNEYHINLGGSGLEIDDWEIRVPARVAVGV